MKTRDDLTVAGLLHDLNNVFQTLVGVAAQLDEDPESAPLAGAILRSVERGMQITGALQNGASQPVPFEQIAANAGAFLADYRLASGGPEVRVECDIQPGIELKGHWAWERVLVNLFLNSHRAMPKGGVIRVTAHRKGSEVTISVTDEGAGIPAAVRKSLFEPHVSSNGSSGLGLHIVRSIVEAHGGTVRAANRRAGGAEFVILLPAISAKKSKRAHA